ncbi:MAG TPA: hypothetical protein VGF12_23560 [Roseateles sp.]|uniref:hypothetical protein n=1 Tax=Roseateles sp. TaxID=1971397 RepID=UPI002ED8DEB6
MQALRVDPVPPGWQEGWLVLRVKEKLPGDFVSIHARAEQALEDAHLRGPGHQVFHGRHREATGEIVVD